MQAFIPIAIYFITPIIGLLGFLYFIKKVVPKKDKTSFQINAFVTFFCLGGLLQIMLTILFWEWSGLASLGFAFLLLIAPFFMMFIAYKAYEQKEDFAQDVLFKMSLSFFIAFPVIIFMSLVIVA